MWEDRGAVHVRKDMLKTCWPWHAEEPNIAKQFRESLLVDLVHTVFIYAVFKIWYKYQEALCKFSLPCFFCLAAVEIQVGIYCKYSVLYTRPTLHFSIHNHIFSWLFLPPILVYFSDLLAVKYVNLILWLKVYVACNDLNILKILSGVMWMKNKP